MTVYAAAARDAERDAWEMYRRYCVSAARMLRTYFQGDETSHALWRVWKAASMARRAEASPFYRRPRRLRA